MSTGKCPKCEKVVDRVKVEDIKFHEATVPPWGGVSFLCPHCETILGVGQDLVTLRHDIEQAVVRKLEGIMKAEGEKG